MITAGIDCGAKYTKAAIMEDGQVVSRSSALTGFDQSGAVKQALDDALNNAGLSRDQITRVGGTGSGMKQISDADVEVNDVKAIAAAANLFFPNCRTVADVGAEHGRAVKVDEAGNVADFAINEKCAAGTGAFIEAMARALETPLEQIGALALTSDKSIPMNAQCTIFAESEVVGLIHAGTTKADISKAIHDAIASRIVSMIRRIGVNPDIVIVGGVAYNPGFLAAVRRELSLGQLFVPDQPEYAAAVGAAVVAAKEGK
jgi:benzoyl-CoA reductase subunit D